MHEFESGKPILVVEDCAEDFEAIRRAFERSNLRNPLYRAEDGDEALDFVFKRGAWQDMATPAIVLLDLNLPGTDGRDVLREMKSDERLMRIPVIILTTSDAPSDVDACYAMGANSYVQKPVSLENFVAAIARLQDYWLEIAVLPKID